MKPIRTRRFAKAAVPLLATIAVTVGIAGAVSGAPRTDGAIDGPGRPDYEPPDDFEPPLPIDVSVRLTAETFDWSWPGVYDSAFGIEYTVTNDGDARLNDFRIVEENANVIVHDCYNYNQPLDPGESVTCSALLLQSVNPQTVRSIVYSRSDFADGWVADRNSSTYTRRRVIDRPIDLDVADGGLGGVLLPR